MKKSKLYQQLYFQVLIGILLGILLGHFYPHFAVKMKFLGTGFIQLIRMMIAPIIFTTVVSGIAGMKEMKAVGRIGLRALIYFELMTTFALLIGLVVANVFRPGAGMNVDLHSLSTNGLEKYTTQTESFDALHFILSIIPDTLVGAFTKGDILPVLFISILFGFGLLQCGDKLKSLTNLIDQFSILVFTIISFFMKLAPLGAFGAMAYTVGAFGIHTLMSLGGLVANVYLTSAFFIFVVLGIVANRFQLNLWKFLNYIKEELFVALGTSSSEVVLPKMMTKLEQMGCDKAVVGLVIPTGYTFNLDGTCIYLTIAALFIAQALNIDLPLGEQLLIVAVLLLTSKGAAAVAGGGFITLMATLSTLHTIPVEGVILLLGVDKFLSDARSLTNLIGNGVATVIVAKWEGNFDEQTAKRVLYTRDLSKC